MQSYNFDEIIPRQGTGCVKWDEPYPSSFSASSPEQDFIPLWVADMDFAVAPAIQEAVRRRAEHPVFGYTHVGDDYYDAVISWFRRRHQWEIRREEILYTTGVVPAMSVAVKALTMPGEKVVILSPDYNCFFSAIRNNGCEVSESPLLSVEHTTLNFKIDWPDFEARCADPKCTVFLLCNPHNPTGRVWTREELSRMNDICLRHGVRVVSDEIHCELIMPGYTFTPFAAVSEECRRNSVILNSPSKSFNIAGLMTANIICSDPEVRRRLDRAININEVCDLNPFGPVALVAAYNESEAWIDALNEYLWGNYQALKTFYSEQLPQCKVTDLEGTYLTWVDMSPLLQPATVGNLACQIPPLTTVQQLCDYIMEKARVWVNPGTMYGPQTGEGFVRINIACPRQRLMKALNSIGRLFMTLIVLVCSLVTQAQQTTDVEEFNLAGPFPVRMPLSMDTVDVKGKAFDPLSLLASIASNAEATATCQAGPLPVLNDSRSVGVLSFYINNSSFLDAKLKIKGPKQHKLFIDGAEVAGEDLKLAPDHHTIAIKYLAEPSDSDSVRVSIEAAKAVVASIDKKHPYGMHDLFDGRRVRGVSLSPDGSYVALSFKTTERDGSSQWDYELREVKSGRLVNCPANQPEWMPRTMAAIEEEKEQDRRVLYQVNPLTGERKRWAVGLPEGSYTVSPTEDYIIINVEEEGTKEDDDVFEVLEMDDRQPDWRKRTYLALYDVKTGLTQRITFGTRNVSLEDISADGRTLLVSSYYTRLTKRPTSVTDFFLLDRETLKADTLFTALEFIDAAEFGSDGSKILFKGTPEAFGRIGCQLPDSVFPNMTENELYLYDLASKKVTPLTRDFDPSVESVEWSKSDGYVWFMAEERDYQRLFRLDPATGDIRRLDIPGDYVYRWTHASQFPVIGYLAYDTMAPASAYVVNVKSAKTSGQLRGQAGGLPLQTLTLFDGRTAIADAQMGTCQDWNFTNSKGDTVYGRLYLPKDFDASKKYPLIVYYYGGCSPVGRYFESPYSPQLWNALGYVAYIPQPSGATGFGQEWASRHVNTAGHGPAEDIIEGTKRLCDEHPFIDREKIGCMGASYGGFMTQYLQTVTDIFACAVSHAGIANHTSYWGEGYWGYNYSEVSMAGSYPWSHRQLYVDQSPLFNADKIHTPLLLLHGNADTNVPLIESLQMFTALKLLGREVALVEVEGQNHHILDYKKRLKWLSTQMAWFQRWLKDDPSWWNALYPKKNL